MKFRVSLALFVLACSFPVFAEKFHDVSRIEEVEIARLEHVEDVNQIQDLVKGAIESNLKISIAGARHSQGGHIYTDGGLVLDMTGFNKLLYIDEKSKIIKLSDSDVSILNEKDIMRMKKNSGRPQDLEDIAALEKLN